MRVYDLFYPERFAEKLKENLDYHAISCSPFSAGADAVDYDEVLTRAMADAEQIKPMVADVSAALHAVNKAGFNLLFEGAQGTLLDIDHGTYPFVTSSNCVAGQASAGSGVGACMLNYVLTPMSCQCRNRVYTRVLENRIFLI